MGQEDTGWDLGIDSEFGLFCFVLFFFFQQWQHLPLNIFLHNVTEYNSTEMVRNWQVSSNNTAS